MNAIAALSKSAKESPARMIKFIIIITSPRIKMVFLPKRFITKPAKKGAINKAPPTPQDMYSPLSKEC